MDNMELNQYKWNSEDDFLGRGTFAEVFRAHTDKGGLVVALKIATEATLETGGSSGGSGSIRNKYRLEEEYTKGKDLSHTHIIRYWDLEYLTHIDHMNRKSRNAVLIMEYADKGSLEQKLSAGKLPEETALHIALEILNGLTYLHSQGIIHRDLKPANILFKTSKLGTEVAKLTDFGISRDTLAPPTADAPSSTAGIGTSFYMAPEQFLKKAYGLKGSISSRTDFWAWAVIFYRMLTGHLPFGGGSTDYELLQQEITASEPDYGDVPTRYQPLLKACFKKHAAERPEDEKAILEFLDLKEPTRPPVHIVPQSEPTLVDHPVKMQASDATQIVQLPKTEISQRIRQDKSAPEKKTRVSRIVIIVISLLVVVIGAWIVIKPGDHKTHNDTDVVVDVHSLSAKPINPQLRAAVQITDGSMNAYIASIDRSNRWALNKADIGNTEVFGHLANAEDLKKSLKAYINSLIEFGVAKTDIHFIVRDSDARKQQIPQITSMVETLGYDVVTISTQQEASDILRAGLPAKYSSEGFVLDIEKTNTVIAFAEDSSHVNGLNTYGSHYPEKGITDESLNKSVSQVAGTVPKERRQVCFVMGQGAGEFLGAQQGDMFMKMKDPGSYGSTGGGLNIYKAVYEATGCNQFIYNWESNAAVGYLLRLN